MSENNPNPVPEVAKKTYRDSGSGHTHCWHIYYDEESGEFDVSGHCKCSDCPETTEAPEEHREMWENLRKRRSKAKQEIRNIQEKFDNPRECPACGNDNVKRVRNEWVCRQVQNCTADYEDPDPVYFCPDCECNIWMSAGMTRKSLCIGANAIEEGADVVLSRTIGSSNTPSQRRRKYLEGPDEYEETLQEFQEELQSLRSSLGVEHSDAIPA